jgi:hypothetical protein
MVDMVTIARLAKAVDWCFFNDLSNYWMVIIHEPS